MEGTVWPQVIWIVGVALAAILFQRLNHISFRVLDSRVIEPNQETRTLRLLRNIVSVFIAVCALILGSYAFFEESAYDLITNNLLRAVWFFFVTASTIVAVSFVETAFERALQRSRERGDGDITAYRFFRYAAVMGTYLIGVGLFALAIPGLQAVAQSALAGAGMLAVVAGIASQEALSNLVGGLLIVIFRPFKIRDTIELSGTGLIGVVEDITLRHTVIRDFQNQRIVVPNAVINKEVLTNHDLEQSRTCRWIEVGVAYDTDLAEARRLMQEACEAHPHCIDGRTLEEREAGAPLVAVRVLELGDSAIVLRAWVWAESQAKGFVLECDLRETIKNAFDDHGVTIPFPQRTLHLPTTPS